MPKLVVNGALLKCTCGVAPATLTVLPMNQTDDAQLPVATIQDNVPMVNVAPFGMCTSPANPQVAAATAAAAGVLTPQPCIPVLPAPWSPGAANVTVNEIAALTDASTCQCQWAGTIQITQPGSNVDVD